jgi:hypothetical protein
MPVALDKCIYNSKTDTYITAKGIITFAAVAKKWKDREKKDDDGQFALTLIFPPETDLSLIQDAAKKAAVDGSGGKAKGLKSPFLKAEEKLEDERRPEDFDPEGWIMVRANTYTERPGVIFANGETCPVDELSDEVYNGRWARMSIRPKYYDQNGNKGVKFYLHNIQLLDDGEKWPTSGGRTAAEDDFEPVETGGGKPGKASTKSADSIFE